MQFPTATHAASQEDKLQWLLLQLCYWLGCLRSGAAYSIPDKLHPSVSFRMDSTVVRHIAGVAHLEHMTGLLDCNKLHLLANPPTQITQLEAVPTE